MNYSIKSIMKNIKNKNDLEKNLADYANLLSTNYNQYAMFAFSMKYFIFYQALKGLSDNDIDNEEKVLIDRFNSIIKRGVLDEFDGQVRQDCIIELDELRNELIERMDVLTDFAGKLLIYEYVIYREKYKIENKDDTSLFDESVIDEIVDFILDSEDKSVVVDKIKSVVGQLPMRMTRSKFFELLNNALTLFKDSSKEELSSYLYKVRSSSSLYKPESAGKYYTNLSKQVEKIANFDYDNINEDNFKDLYTDYEDLSSEVRRASEFMIELQEIVNSVYAYILTKPYLLDDMISQKENEVCISIIKSVNDDYTSDSEYDEDSFEKNAMKFESIEGCQERFYMDCSKLESELDIIKEEYDSQIESMMLAKQFKCLTMSELLLSTSLFVKFDKEDDEEKVTDDYLKETYIKLESEFKELFKNSSKKIRRSIMASVTYELPMLFTSRQEIYDYIFYAFDACRDTLEKKACCSAVRDVMNEYLLDDYDALEDEFDEEDFDEDDFTK